MGSMGKTLWEEFDSLPWRHLRLGATIADIQRAPSPLKSLAADNRETQSSQETKELFRS